MNDLYSKQYDAANYNCAHFLCDAWLRITGVDLKGTLSGLIRSDRHADMSIRKSFRRLHNPVTPCIVFMRNRFETGHVGVYLRGRILHLTDSGVTMTDYSVATMGYSSVRFYVNV